MILTISKLRQLGACEDALARLEAIFGLGPVEVTEALCVAHASDCNWDLAAECLLEPAAHAEYRRITDTAWAIYASICAPEVDEYLRITAPEVDGDRIQAAAREERDRSIAAAFGKLAEAQP